MVKLSNNRHRVFSLQFPPIKVSKDRSLTTIIPPGTFRPFTNHKSCHSVESYLFTDPTLRTSSRTDRFSSGVIRWYISLYKGLVYQVIKNGLKS